MQSLYVGEMKTTWHGDRAVLGWEGIEKGMWQSEYGISVPSFVDKM